MKRRSLVAMAWAVVFVASALAQGGGAAADPISGKWGSEGATYLELQFDGKSNVSGTAIWRHDGREERSAIRRGTFDRQSGSLKLAGETKDPDGNVVQFLIAGALEKDTLSGTFTVGEHTGEFAFTRQ